MLLTISDSAWSQTAPAFCRGFSCAFTRPLAE